MSSSTLSPNSLSSSDTHTVILENLNWIKRQVFSYTKNLPVHISYQDCYQMAIEYLLKYSDRYDPSRGSYKTFAVFRIRQAVSDARRSFHPGVGVKKFIQHESLDAPNSIMIPYEPLQEDISFMNFLPRALSKLNEKQQTVIKGIYYEELLYEDIAKKIGVSRQRVQQLHEEALAKLRSSLSRRDKKLIRRKHES